MRWGEVREEVCAYLKELVLGRDRWSEFWHYFGPFFIMILKERGVHARNWDMLYQDVRIRLWRADCRALRHYLAGDTSVSFLALLRPVITSAIYSSWRQERRWRGVGLFGLSPRVLLPDKQMAGTRDWRLDPAERLEREAILICSFAEVAARRQDSMAESILYDRYVLEESVNSIAAKLGLDANRVSVLIGRYVADLKRMDWPELRGLLDE